MQQPADVRVRQLEGLVIRRGRQLALRDDFVPFLFRSVSFRDDSFDLVRFVSTPQRRRDAIARRQVALHTRRRRVQQCKKTPLCCTRGDAAVPHAEDRFPTVCGSAALAFRGAAELGATLLGRLKLCACVVDRTPPRFAGARWFHPPAPMSEPPLPGA